jgi:TonB family protein
MSPTASGRLLASASREAEHPRGTALLGGVLLALLAGGLGGYAYFARASAADAHTASSLSPEEEAALSRVRRLEEALARLEREKAELEAQLEASASANGSGTVLPAEEPPVAVAAVSTEPDSPVPDPRAEERLRAPAEKVRREEQIRRLEGEIRASQKLLVAEQGHAGAAPDLDLAVRALPASLPTPEPPPPTPPPVVAGQLLDAADPEVSGPELIDKGPEALLYPSAAKQWRRSAEVTVEALVGEDGQVLQTRVLESSVEGMGFEDAAERKVRLFRYRPASKEGVPVRVWIQVPVRFTP